MWGPQVSLLWLLACFLSGECFRTFPLQALRQPLIRTNQYLQRKQIRTVGREFRYRLWASEEDGEADEDEDEEDDEWDEDDLDLPPAEISPLYPTTSVKNVEVSSITVFFIAKEHYTIFT